MVSTPDNNSYIYFPSLKFKEVIIDGWNTIEQGKFQGRILMELKIQGEIQDSKGYHKCESQENGKIEVKRKKK